MKCPFCIDKNKETSVLDSRPSENGSVIRRRRICIDCKGRFTTHERIQFREIVVVKKDGDKVYLDSAKNINPNIASVGWKETRVLLKQKKVNVALAVADKTNKLFPDDVEGMGENEISSNVIGESVMKALFSIDKVAYVRFASVYRDFRETKDFEQFLDTIDKK